MNKKDLPYNILAWIMISLTIYATYTGVTELIYPAITDERERLNIEIAYTQPPAGCWTAIATVKGKSFHAWSGIRCSKEGAKQKLLNEIQEWFKPNSEVVVIEFRPK